MSEEPKYKWIGTRPIRPDGLDKVTGRANFGADMTFPGMLHGKVLRSPHAHARIRSINVKPALALEGVKAVITGADLPTFDPSEMIGPTAVWDLARNIMARDKALYDGHAVAAVAATTARQAEAALGAIEVDYEVLEPVMDLDTAIAPDAPILDEAMRAQGQDPKPEGPTNVGQPHPDRTW